MNDDKVESTLREKLIDSHKKTLTQIDEFVKVMVLQLGQGVQVIVSSLKECINNQGMELIILRQLEHGIRDQTLSTTEIKELLDELLDLRQKMRAKAEAAVAEATTLTSTKKH